MTSRARALLPIVLCLPLAALACSLPGRLLRSAASEAIDTIQNQTAEVDAPEEEEEEDESEGAVDPSDMIGGLLGGFSSSPPYDIYVGANVTGNCGPFTNSGGFASLTFDSVIPGVRFSLPSEEGLPGPYGGITQEAALPISVPGMGLLGEGELGAFTFCPEYEAPDRIHTCRVTSGPSPFEPSLSLGVSEGSVPVVPLVSTPGTPAAGGGEGALLVYSIGSTSDMSPIMTWDCGVGGSALGGALEPVQVTFSASWDQLMLGEEFSLDAIGEDEAETWEWTIRFVPAE